jgi:anti-sigma factor RsiW
MKECPDEGRLQSFFDGELPAEVMEETARHVASCAICTRAAREVESENAIFLQALEPELSAGVPTEQLRMRITGAIVERDSPLRQAARDPVGRSSWLASLTELFRFTPQRATALAGILAVIILGSVFAVVRLRNGQEASPPPKMPVVKVTPPEAIAVPTDSPRSSPPDAQLIKQVTSRDSRSTRPPQFDALATEDRLAGVKLIPGEESYLRTIAGLDVGLKGGQRSMSPATRAEYERNLKLVDYAIAATRSKAKRSPHDPDAAEFMFAAYQSKIDLLSTMTETARLTPH